MNLDDYIANRRARDRRFDEGYDDGRALFFLAQALHLARKDAGLTQIELGRKARLSPWQVSKLERRIEHASPAEIGAAAAALAPWLKRYSVSLNAQPTHRAATFSPPQLAHA